MRVRDRVLPGTPARTSRARMEARLSPLHFTRRLWRYRDLVWQMTERDARSRYRGSAGGLFWVAFHPVLMLAVYTVFFTEVFPTRWSGAAGSRADFALVLFVGLLLHGLLAETMHRAPTLVTGNANLVKKVVFPSTGNVGFAVLCRRRSRSSPEVGNS